MKLKFGMYKGMDLQQVPTDYLRWIITNFDDNNEVKVEALRILKSGNTNLEQQYKSLEEQANEILGEKPVDLLKRGYRRHK